MKSLGHTVEPSGKEIFFSVLDGNQVLDRTWPQEDLGRPEPARMAPWREKEIKRQLSNTQRGEENLEERTGAGRQKQNHEGKYSKIQSQKWNKKGENNSTHKM
jgi:hypothetical protein